MISPSETPVPPVWGDEPVVIEVAMRLFASLSAHEIVQRLERDGWDPGEVHRELARRSIAAASTFAEALEHSRESLAGHRDRRSPPRK